MSSILFENADGVGTIRLNRPDKLNSFNRGMALQMQEVLDECKNESIRAVYIIGEGKAFSAGQDLAEIINGASMDKILSEHYNPIVTRIKELAKPVVAAVNGVAAGAGANIALCCDIVVAAESASFIQAFSKIGLIPDSGGTYTLPRLVGWQKASAIMLLGDKINAKEAEQMGMIYKMLSDEHFADGSMQIAKQLAIMPTKALALTKQALQQSLTSDWKQQLQTEDQLQQQAAASEDYQEGVNAFMQKRKPEFKGG